MAKLFDVEVQEKRKRNIINGAILLFSLFAIVSASYIHYRAEEAEYTEYKEEVKLSEKSLKYA